MASTGKLCAMVILVCILGPIATGYLLPAGSTEHTGYEQGNPVNITMDLYNNTEPYNATYSGFANNAYMMGSVWRQPLGDSAYYTMPDYVDAGSAAGSIRTYSGTSYTESTLYSTGGGLGQQIDWTIPSSTFGSGNKLMVINWNVGTHIDVTTNQNIYVDGEAVTGPTEGGIRYAQGSEFVQIGTHQYPKTSTFRVTGYGGTVTATYFAASGYASDVSGQYVPAAADTWTDGAQWVNYKENVAADYIFRGESYTLTLHPMLEGIPATMATVTLSRAGATVTAGLQYSTIEPNPDYSLDDLTPDVLVTHSTSTAIGNYRDVLVRLQFDEEGNLEVKASGLMYSAGIALNYESRIINLVDVGEIPKDLGTSRAVPPMAPGDPLPEPEPAITYTLPDNFGGFKLSTAAEKTVIAYGAAATYSAGSYSVIVDNTVKLTDYFPGVTSSAELRSISQYGTAVDLPGMANLPVTDGKITITDTGREQHTVPVRNLTLLAVWNGADYDCYVGEIPIGTSAAPAIGLDGAWLLTAYVFKTTAYTYTTQDWVAGSFNLDESGFCVVGLICAFAAFVVAGLWGRKSGSKVLALMIIAAICGFVYFNLLLEV